MGTGRAQPLVRRSSDAHAQDRLGTHLQFLHWCASGWKSGIYPRFSMSSNLTVGVRSGICVRKTYMDALSIVLYVFCVTFWLSVDFSTPVIVNTCLSVSPFCQCYLQSRLVSGCLGPATRGGGSFCLDGLGFLKYMGPACCHCMPLL